MARLYANENFPHPVVERLRALGHDVLTVLQIGKSGQSWPDEAVLEFALREGRILLTLNRRHFVRLHSAGGSPRGNHRLHSGFRFRRANGKNSPCYLGTFELVGADREGQSASLLTIRIQSANAARPPREIVTGYQFGKRYL